MLLEFSSPINYYMRALNESLLTCIQSVSIAYRTHVIDTRHKQ